VTFTNVPAQVSRTSHSVPRTVATAERPRVTKRPWSSRPQSSRTLRLLEAAEAVCRAPRGQLVGASVSVVGAFAPRVWLTVNAPPQKVPVWSLPLPSRMLVSRTLPRRASMLVPTGTVEAALSGR
jgi:hypothetical protein